MRRKPCFKYISQDGKVRTRYETGNASNPHGEGPISLDNFTPFSKNPLICKFFTQLGRVDELGSGVLNVNKYLPVYAPGKRPLFIEGSSFKMIIPLDETMITKVTVSGGTVNGTVSGPVIDTVNKGISEGVKQKLVEMTIAIYKVEKPNTDDLAKAIHVSTRTTKRYIQILKQLNVIEFKGSPKTGGYVLTENFTKGLLS